MLKLKEEDIKIKYKDLSTWLRIAAIGGWISAIAYAIAVLIGLFAG